MDGILWGSDCFSSHVKKHFSGRAIFSNSVIFERNIDRFSHLLLGLTMPQPEVPRNVQPGDILIVVR